MSRALGGKLLDDYFLRTSVKLGKYISRTAENPAWLFVYALSRFNTVRWLSARMAKPPTFPDRRDASPSLIDIDVESVVSTLSADGLYSGINLHTHVADEIFQFASNAEAYANGNREMPFQPSEVEVGQQKYDTKIMVGTFDRPGEQLSVIKQIERDPVLVEIASRYLNTRPVSSSRLWWSFPAESGREEQLRHAQGTFHYDPDVDLRALKFFFYISEVDHSSGPHVCVRGSHTKKKLSHKLTVFIGRGDEAIREYYKPENIITICGPRGFGIAEDPMCFHKGDPPRERARLMLEVLFRTRDL